ncbi:MAG TPA: SMC family ATPase [Gryllotalpicola sp.]
MRILSLVVEGFGPFRAAQSVDFTRFDDFGIFLISGKTGAGKSTILDAICFALYGSVPRYEDYSGAARLRSDYCGPDDDTRVTLMFEANGTEYRIARSPEYQRPKKVGAGTTEQKAIAELAIRTADGWEAVETKLGEVGRRVHEIVKLDRSQFLQVILLAQGRFQEFLEAQSDARQSLLRTLFGTKRFDDYADLLHERARALADELRQLGAGAERTVAELARELRSDAPASGGERLAWAAEGARGTAAALAEVREREAQAATAAEAAQQAFQEATGLAGRQRRRAEAAERLAALEARADMIAVERRLLDAAERAALLAPFLRGADTAGGELARAQAEESAASDALGSMSGGSVSGGSVSGGAAPDGDPAERIDALAGTIGSLAAARDTEARLSGLETAARDAAAALSAHDESTARIVGERAELKARLAALEAEQATADAAAKDLAAAQAALEATQTALAAALDADRLNGELDALKTAELVALQARRGADTLVVELIEHQRLGRAALLADGLAEGEDCPVCGSREHPHLAEWQGEPVSDEQVEAARTAFERASVAAEKATKAVTDRAAEVAARRGAAGGKDAALLGRERESVRARVDVARQAQLTLDGLVAAHASADAALEALAERERTAAPVREELAKTAVLASDALDTARVDVEAGRGGAPSVAARIAALDRERKALQRLSAARNAVAEARRTADVASTTLHEQLSAHAFADRAAAEAAALPAAERRRRTEAVTAHDEGLTESRAVLAQADLQELPAVAADVDGARERRDAATAAKQAATEERVARATTEERVRELAAELAAELARTEALDRQHRIVNRLAATVRGDPPNDKGIPLESFVLAAELEQIVAAANTRLGTMSQGRYAFEHSAERIRGGKRTGLELSVYDAHTGVSRSPRSLSGGEKFLHSLALALGLAEVVTSRAGGIRLDTLFIDEGFGSLDDDTLEVAMQTLDELRTGGRTIGLISHVEAMKEEIPAQLRVEVTEGGWSAIRQ